MPQLVDQARKPAQKMLLHGFADRTQPLNVRMPFGPDDFDPFFPQSDRFGASGTDARQFCCRQGRVILGGGGLQKHCRIGLDDRIQLGHEAVAQSGVVGKFALDGVGCSARDPHIRLAPDAKFAVPS